MPDLALLDAVVLLFLLYRVGRAGRRTLGESLHALVSLLLLVALFLGFRMAREVRGLLGGMADTMQAIPGLGTKLLVIVAAWYLMRLLRERSGHWIGRSIPESAHRRLLPVSEGLRALLLAGFLVWLAEGWFDKPPAPAPLAVELVRDGDRWLAGLIAGSREPINVPRPSQPGH